jgi:hypothetical protein
MDQLPCQRMFLVSFILAVCIFDKGILGEEKTVTLPNAECIPRETVVPIDAPRFSKKPSKVSIFRCDGSFEDVTPSLKRCVQNTSDLLKLNVQNIFTMQNELVNLDNHTSCRHECVYDGSQCNEFQKFDKKKCLCTCNHEKEFVCPEHFKWESTLCQCVCNRDCPFKEHYLDEEECACTCKPRYFRNCNDNGEILQPSNCTCVAPQKQKESLECSIVPTKWAVLIIVLSFCAIFIIAFDCILYTRHTGCFYHTTHICQKKKNEQEESIPIKNRIAMSDEARV